MSTQRRPRALRFAPLLPALLLACLLTGPLTARPAPAADFQRITGPCEQSFPKDLGPHENHRTEWWYVTGHLQADDGRRFGFQFTIFRTALAPEQPQAAAPDTLASDLRTRQVYPGHAALSDLSNKRFHSFHTISRGAPGLAGAGITPDGRAALVLTKGLQALFSPTDVRLSAQGPDFSYQLDLSAAKPIILHGDKGYSQKGRRPESASCYHSFPRLTGRGELVLQGERIPVTASAWADQEWSTAAIEDDVAGWDWFSMRLSDQSELMLFRLRPKDGGAGGEIRSGTFVDPSGQAAGLTAADIRLTPGEAWTSPHSKARYPQGWKLEVPRLGLSLNAKTDLDDQEMRTAATTGVTYYEGSVSVTGSRQGQAVTGEGYVEMTGYDAPLGGKF